MNKKTIIPSVFATTNEELSERMNKVGTLCDHIHLDIMDGTLVPAQSPDLHTITLPSGIHVEAHLMVSHPTTYFEQLHEMGIAKVIMHVESFEQEDECHHAIAEAKNRGMKPFLAVNPETPVASIFQFLPELAGVLIMGVYPGKEHQEFLPQTLIKVAALRTHNHTEKLAIQVDGGINPQTIGKLAQLGVTLFNVGSYLGQATNPKQALKELETAMNAKPPTHVHHPAGRQQLIKKKLAAAKAKSKTKADSKKKVQKKK